MRLLFDQNLSSKLPKRLAEVFPGSVQVSLIDLATASDAEIWRFAAAKGLTIVTLDADFAEMAALYGPPPRVIWLRCGNQPTHVVDALLRRSAPGIAAFADDPHAACLEVY